MQAWKSLHEIKNNVRRDIAQERKLVASLPFATLTESEFEKTLGTKKKREMAETRRTKRKLEDGQWERPTTRKR